MVAPLERNSSMMQKAGDSRTSLVSGRHAHPQIAIGTFCGVGRCLLSKRTISRGWARLISLTAVNNDIGCCLFLPNEIRAFVSLGRQLPPYPQPAARNDVMPAFCLTPSAISPLR